MALILEPIHSANMWITHFSLGYYASNVALGNIFLSAPETAKEKVVLPAVQYFAFFVAQLQASVEMIKSILIWMCGTPTLIYLFGFYWYARCKLAFFHFYLSWKWWLVMVSVLWNLEPVTNGKQINGTYWMHYKADLFAIKSDLKETSRLRRDLGDAAIDVFFNFLYVSFGFLWSHDGS